MTDMQNIALLGFWASLIASLGTGIGATGIFMIKKLSDKAEDVMLSTAAGIMLAASFFSLIIPGMEYAQAQFQNEILAVLVVIAGILVGASMLYVIHHYAPHEHFITDKDKPHTAAFSRIWLFVIAITLHNFPEGMAVGVGFAGGDIGNGVALATGIIIQNIPEGLAVAVSLLAINYTKTQAFTIASLTGLVEPIGGLLGSVAIWLAEPLIPWTLGFAAGAMLFIISDEIIPETHRGGYENLATFSLLGGIMLMMFLNAVLG